MASRDDLHNVDGASALQVRGSQEDDEKPEEQKRRRRLLSSPWMKIPSTWAGVGRLLRRHQESSFVAAGAGMFIHNKLCP